MNETRLQRSRRITKAHGREICEDYSAGGTYASIAAKWGISKMTVGEVLRSNGQTPRTGGPRSAEGGESQRSRNARIFAENEAAILAAYKDATIDQVAQRFGMERGSLARLLRKSGAAIRKRGPREPQYGAANPFFKGGRWTNGDGYTKVLLAPDDPFICMADAKRYVSEHRIVMARLIGRPLMADETVHHVDGDRANNAPGNLQLRRGQHGKHVHIRCHDCGSQNVGPAPI